MHDVVVDTLGRIDAAEETAAFDAVKPKTSYGRPRARPWQLNSQILGTTIRQEDIPRLMTDELAKAAIVPGGIKAITKALNLATPKSLKDYAAGIYRMNYSVGLRFVRYLEEQAKKNGAAPAATDTAPIAQTTEEASADIVPQEDEGMTTLADEQHAEMQSLVETLTRERDALRERVADLELIRDLLRRLLAVNAL